MNDSERALVSGSLYGLYYHLCMWVNFFKSPVSYLTNNLNSDLKGKKKEKKNLYIKESVGGGDIL